MSLNNIGEVKLATIFWVFGMTRPEIEPRSLNNISKVKLVTFVEGDRRLPFQKLLHRGVGEGTSQFPGFLHFTLDPHLIVLSAKQGGIKYHFLSLWYDSTWDWTPVFELYSQT